MTENAVPKSNIQEFIVKEIKQIHDLQTATKEQNEVAIHNLKEHLKQEAEKHLEEVKSFKSEISSEIAELKRLPMQSQKEIDLDEATFKELDKVMANPGLAGDKTSSIIKELKYLNTESNVQGGFLIPVAQSDKLIKRFIEISPIREYATVISTNNIHSRIPVLQTYGEAYFISEAAPVTISEPTFSEKEVTLNAIAREVEVSADHLAFYRGGESLIRDVALKSIAFKEAASFINGEGSAKKQPQGLLPGVSKEIKSGISNKLNYQKLFGLIGQIRGYNNLTYAFNSSTMVEIFTLTNNDGTPIFPAVLSNLPNTLFGRPFFIDQNLPDITDGATPVILGDFKQYQIYDGSQINLLINPYKYNGRKTVYTFAKYVGALVVDENAFCKYKIGV